MIINKPNNTNCFLHARKSAQSTLVRREESVGDGHEKIEAMRLGLRKPAVDSARGRWGFVEPMTVEFA